MPCLGCLAALPVQGAARRADDMKKRWIAIAVFWLTALIGSSPAALAQDVAVVVNSKNPVSNLSLSEVRKLFAGEKTSWSGNVPVRLIVRAPEARERTVLLKLLGMSEKEYTQHWIEQVFRGEAQAEPVALFSNGMQKEAIGAFPGAIAFFDAREVKPGMKVLKVDGRLPGEPGYPLH
jgi:ABC-type phosphate transport system substrate-binding protein